MRAEQHGVGRVDMVENRYVGMKSRGVYETPGGAILHFVHRQIESLTMDREVMHLRDSLIPRYAERVYYGYWFSPERLALQTLVTESQKNVTGTVRVKLYKGNIMVAGRKSPVSLYNPHIATMEADPTKAYNQYDATGFIRRNGMRLKVAAKLALSWPCPLQASSRRHRAIVSRTAWHVGVAKSKRVGGGGEGM